MFQHLFGQYVAMSQLDVIFGQCFIHGDVPTQTVQYSSRDDGENSPATSLGIYMHMTPFG